MANLGNVSGINGNNNYWKLYAADPKVREGAKKEYGVGGQQFGGEGTKGTAGFQARESGFDWQTLNKFNYSLTGATKPNTEIASTSVAGINGSEGNIFTEGIGQKATTPINPSSTVAKGENQPLQAKLANIGSGELTPAVSSPELANKIQYFA